MNSLFFVFLIVSVCCSRIYCSTVTTTENYKLPPKSVGGISTVKNDENQRQGKQISLKDVLSAKQSSLRTEELKSTSTKIDSSKRKSKILGSLAFLAGLSVGGVAGAASSNVKTYAKLPPMNFDVSRVPPHNPAGYDPYPYAPSPYIFANPLRLFPFWDPLQLQYLSGIQSGFQALTQNPQILNLLDNKKPTDLLNSNDEYTEVAKQVENVKTSSDAEEETDESVELQVEDDRNAEEKVSSSNTACKVQKGSNKKQSNLSKSKTREDADLKVLSLRAANVTERNVTNPQNKTMHAMTNSTTNGTGVTASPFYGYYGGYPQDINHVDLTTETNEYKYQDHEHIGYNLPSYDKPANFYSNDRYNFYSNPHVDSYPPSQFQPEHVPEYFSNDFNRFLYTPDNTPPFVNDFRPVA